MARAFRLKVGDLRPVIYAEPCTPEGELVDLSAAATQQLLMRTSGFPSLMVRGLATITNTVALGLPGVPSQARLAFAWAAGNTATPGYFQAEFEVRASGGITPQSFPSRGYIPVVIDVDLG